MNFQQRLDSCDFYDLIEIPIGEFEGPFVVRKPCTIVGSSSVLWARKGPVLTIEANDVKLSNFQVEVTETSTNKEDLIAICSKGSNQKFENVEVVGQVVGVPDEENEWNYPRLLTLNDIPADTEAIFQMEITTTTKAKLVALIKGVELIPEELHAGKNRVMIKVDKLQNGTFLYGDFVLVSTFVRRIYVSGRVTDKPVSYLPEKIIFPVVAPATEDSGQTVVSQLPEVSDNITLLKRGQRLAIENLLTCKVDIHFSYARLLQHLEVDPYIFLLDQNGRARSDEQLIFFGNNRSTCGGVEFRESKSENTIALDLQLIAPEIHKISICFAVYEDQSNSNFSMIVSPTMRLVCDGVERIWFTPEELKFEKTVVFIEFYRYQQSWKINAIGAGYHEGLKKLCESFGLIVM